jgi:signal transduction histidine kinase
MAAVFEEQIRQNAVMQGTTSSPYLDSLAEIFLHGLGSPLSALTADINMLRTVTNDHLRPALTEAGIPQVEDWAKRIDKTLDRLTSEKHQIREYADSFAKDISGFGKMGRYDLIELVDETIDLVTRQFLAKGARRIRILFDRVEAKYAYCSTLLKQHLFSILANSIYSLEERETADVSHDGVITIAVEEGPSPADGQEVELNKRWMIKIRDNGTGVEPSDLDALRMFRRGMHFRKSYGQGFGLQAAQSYMEAIEGGIELDSSFEDYFEVRLILSQFKPDIHVPLSTRFVVN